MDTSTQAPPRPAVEHPDIVSPHLVSGRGYALLVAGLVLAVVAAGLVGISVGAVSLPLETVWRVIGDHIWGAGATGDPVEDQIVWQFRTPRALLAIVVGAGLAVAGVVLQAVVRNPLADPYVLGVASGASLGAVAVLTLGSAAVAGLGISAAAFAGGMVSLVLVFLLGQHGGSFSPTRLVLAGVAIGYLFSAATSFLQLRADPNELRGTLFWLLGSVAGAEWSDLGVPSVAVLTTSVWLALQGRRLNALLMGEESATALGVDVDRFRLQLMVAASALTGVVIAVAGGIGFVGLLIPHLVRLLVGPDHRRVLPVAVLLGGGYLVLVDLAARTVARPAELPIGIFTAAVGTPFFLWLMHRRRRVDGAA